MKEKTAGEEKRRMEEKGKGRINEGKGKEEEWKKEKENEGRKIEDP